MKKRIIPIIALSLIAVIAITTVVFAICTANFKPNFKEANAITLLGTEVNDGSSIYLNGTNAEQADTIKKINELYNNSFNESALNALFNGRLGYGAELIKKENAIKNINELKKCIIFEYENKEDLPKVTYNEKEISFDRVVVEITEVKTGNIQLVKVYLVQEEATSSSYYFQTYGNFYALFDYVNELI